MTVISSVLSMALRPDETPEGILRAEIEAQSKDTGITAAAKLGGVARSQAEKNSDILHARDFGIIGDGVTDETVKLKQALLTAEKEGRLLHLPENSTLVVSSALRTSANLVGNKCTLRFTNPTPQQFCLTFLDGMSVCSDLNLLVENSGKSNVRGLTLASCNGSKVSNISVEYVEQSTDWLNSDEAFRIESCTNCTVEYVKVSAALPVSIRDCEGINLSNFDLYRYFRGLYIRGSKNIIVDKLICHTILSIPLPEGSGNHGLLIESSSSRRTKNVQILNSTIHEGTQSNFRLGGAHTAENITFSNCTSFSSTGNGFKALGRDFDNRHISVNYLNCFAYDSGTVSENKCGFLIQNVIGGTAHIRVDAKQKDNSSYHGLRLSGCYDYTADGYIAKSFSHGVFVDSPYGAQHRLITNTTSYMCGGNGLHLRVDGQTFAECIFKHYSSSCIGAGLGVTNVGGLGELLRTSFDLTLTHNASPIVSDIAIQGRVLGDFNADYVMQGGSMWTDAANAITYISKDGQYVAL